jgi:hypothetical protein
MRPIRFLWSVTALSAGVGVGAIWLPDGGASQLAGGARWHAQPPASVARPADSVPRLDPIARLQARINAGEVVLTADSTLGYLPAVLRALQIPVSSQGLVFSRTSLQTDKITPWSPRAVYFSDDVYIGYVQESRILEIAAVNPETGGAFYTLSQEPREKPQFSRETTMCLMCHQSKAITGGVPGFMVLSTIVDRHGYAITGVHDGVTTDATPVSQRFGGWYVTGSHGAAGHSGNVNASLLAHEVGDKAQYRSQINMTTESARLDLKGKFDATPYLSAESDIVSLMVLVHQTVVHNDITALHEAARDAARLASVMESATERERASDAYAMGSPMRVSGLVNRLARDLLFVGAAPLKAPMHGTTSFATDFALRGPRDGKGRSLRAFDLETRLFKYPLSFLIYTDAFDALPTATRAAVYRVVYAALRGDEPEFSLTHIPAADRQAAIEILEATKPEFVAMRAVPR